MSSNNQLVILKNEKNKFEIYENLCMVNEFDSSKEILLSTEKNLIEAIKFVEKYCQEIFAFGGGQ